MFFQLYDPLDEKEASLLNVLQLAYIGDAVWEIVIRNHLIRQGYNLRHIHSECIMMVNAHAQAQFAELLQPVLTPEESDLMRRGRNAHSHHPVPRNQNPEDYSMATSFEVLLGFLYLTGREERIQQIVTTLIGGTEHG